MQSRENGLQDAAISHQQALFEMWSVAKYFNSSDHNKSGIDAFPTKKHQVFVICFYTYTAIIKFARKGSLFRYGVIASTFV